MSVATTPASTIPTRNSAGSRKRSDLSTGSSAGCGGSRGGLVPDSPNGDDRRRVAELPPQLADVDIDGPGIAGERVSPHALEQLVARQDEAAVIEELPEEIELLGRKPDLLVPHAALASAGVEHELPVAHDPGVGLRPPRAAAQDRSHPRHEL